MHAGPGQGPACARFHPRERQILLKIVQGFPIGRNDRHLKG